MENEYSPVSVTQEITASEYSPVIIMQEATANEYFFCL
jgi:hypothetical protein